jgi:PEP-CTERM motif
VSSHRKKSHTARIVTILALAIAAASAARADYQFTPITAPGGSADLEPYGVMPNGTVSGLYADSGGTYHGFLAQGSTFTTVDVPGNLNATSTSLYAGNAAGVFAGGYDDPAGIFHAGTYNSASQAWTFLPDPTPTSQFSLAGAITNSGIIFGNWADNIPETNLHGWAYHNGTYTFFDAPSQDPNGIGIVTFGANNAGDLVGYYQDAADNIHGFLRHLDGSFVTIDVPGAINTELVGINDLGMMVGRYRDATGRHGFLDDNGVITTIDNPAFANTVLTGIANNGDMVGYGYNDIVNGPFGGFEVRSVPEPSSFLLAALGALGLLGLHRRAKRREQSQVK